MKLHRLSASWIVLSLVSATACSLHGQELDPRFSDFSIDGFMRFGDSQQAEDRRDKLVRTIWPMGLPLDRPRVVDAALDVPELRAVDRTRVGKVQIYDVNVSNFGFHSLTYVAHPTNKIEGPARLAIVHAGHMPAGEAHYLEAGLSQSVERLLGEGFVVAVMQMPLVGWNHDSDGVLPDGTTFDVQRRGTSAHNELFAQVEPTLKGGTMRFFLEPVVQVTNELLASEPHRAVLLMIGLSGGGWTTHMSAAIDPRIDVSIPVAGAFPLYARSFSQGSHGDEEQQYAPIYGEEDADGDGVPDRATGVASWLEIFALGAIAAQAERPRRQIQVLNLYDSCCFHGPMYKTYEVALIKRVDAVGRGRWQLHVDDSHRGHLISAQVIDQVLGAAIRDATGF